MRYFVQLDAEPAIPPLELDVVEEGGGFRVSHGGAPLEADVVPTPLGFSILVGGKVIDLVTEGTSPELGMVVPANHGGYRGVVRVESERSRTASRSRGRSGGPAEKVVKSPMPGRIVKILVAPGDAVAPGQPLFVVEAMKMENEVKAKVGAVVAEVHVAAGSTVEASAKLLTFAT